MLRHALTHLAALTIEGRDAQAFCQSQLTIDMAECLDGMWHPAAWCEASGLTITTLLVRGTAEHIEWVMPSVLLNQVVAQLQPFTIGRQVSLTKGEAVFGTWDALSTGGLAYDPTRYLITSRAATEDRSGDTCSIRWRQHDITLGMPWLNQTLSRQYIPQALGLERLGGISFRKGCYPGQEVIAKVHYRGQAKQRLAPVSVTMPTSPLDAGTDLFMADATLTQTSTRPVGRLVAHVKDWALAIIRHDLPLDTPLATEHGGQMIGQVTAFSVATLANSVS